MLGVLLPGATARAEKSADQVCDELAAKAKRTLWSSVRESGDAIFCRKSCLAGTPEELRACGLWTTTNVFDNKTKNAWNKFFASGDSEWATWGPRGISVDWEEGTIVGGFKRSFFGAGLATFKSTVEVTKRGGQAEAFLTVCELDYDGKVVSKQRKSFPAGSRRRQDRHLHRRPQRQPHPRRRRRHARLAQQVRVPRPRRQHPRAHQPPARTRHRRPARAPIHEPRLRRPHVLGAARAFTPGPPGAPPPATPNALHVNLVQNIGKRLNLQVDRILPLHGRVVPVSELSAAIGRKN